MKFDEKSPKLYPTADDCPGEFKYSAIDPIGDQLLDLNQFITWSLSTLTIEEFKEALTIAMQYKDTNGGTRCRPIKKKSTWPKKPEEF